jgi:hypothetical protein
MAVKNSVMLRVVSLLLTFRAPERSETLPWVSAFSAKEARELQHTHCQQNNKTGSVANFKVLSVSHFHHDFFFKKALTVLRGPLAYPNGLLDLHIETFGTIS